MIYEAKEFRFLPDVYYISFNANKSQWALMYNNHEILLDDIILQCPSETCLQKREGKAGKAWIMVRDAQFVSYENKNYLIKA